MARRDKAEERRIVRGRIDHLMQCAEDEVRYGGPRADRYAQLARRVGMRYQMPLQPGHKARICKACGAYRSTGTARVRVQRHRIVTTCLACGTIRRRPLGAPA